MDPTAEPGYFDTIFSNVGSIFSDGITQGTAQTVNEWLNPTPAPNQIQTTGSIGGMFGSSQSLLIAGLVIGLIVLVVLRK